MDGNGENLPALLRFIHLSGVWNAPGYRADLVDWGGDDDGPCRNDRLHFDRLSDGILRFGNDYSGSVDVLRISESGR